ncbi:MAG TPA: FAD-dependent oxidoreductase, partial [Chitinophagaceae bacterium]|nr:FAD-dependent oxidoreductase [Chitinophagaceae bacterium]
MELTAGQPFWLIKEGLLYHYPKLESNKKTRVVIIGGGITGALVAYQLTQVGIECILLDARSIGLGSTCASTSLLQYEMDIPLHRLSKQIGWEKAKRAYQACGEAIGKLVSIMEESGYSGFETNPSLFFSTHKKEAGFIKKEWQARKEAGFEVELLGTEEMRDFYGLKASHGILSATGATISTYTLTHHLLQ